VLAAAPEHAYALHYLGVIHYQHNRPAEALPLLERAVERVPQEAEFHNNLGLALAASDRFDEAIAAHRRALALNANHAVAWNNLGLALQAMNELPAAIDAFHHALKQNSDFAQAHWNLGLALLAVGESADGWREYEWRLRIAELGKSGRTYPGPRWTGENPPAKRSCSRVSRDSATRCSSCGFHGCLRSAEHECCWSCKSLSPGCSPARRA
jgi:tetratricopeptide (TPR) repeat protein